MEELWVTVWLSDGRRERWRLPDGQTPDEAYDELRQVIVGGRWFRPAGSTRAYSPYAIVAVEVASRPDPDSDSPSAARRLGEAVGDAISNDDVRR